MQSRRHANPKPHLNSAILWASLDSTQKSVLFLILDRTRKLIGPRHVGFVVRSRTLELRDRTSTEGTEESETSGLKREKRRVLR